MVRSRKTTPPLIFKAVRRRIAAALVTAVRHVDPEMTPRGAAERIADHPEARKQFREALREKLAACNISGAEAERVLGRLDELQDAWQAIADAQTQEGGELVYERADPPQRLLQDPLKRLATDLDGRRAWFEAGRSMRDTGPASLLKLRRPDGSPFARSML